MSQRGTSLDVYDPATNAWTTKAPMPAVQYIVGSTVANGLLYVLGGDSTYNVFQSLVQVYDPATNSWAVIAPMPTGRIALAASTIKGVVYALGGTNGTVLGQLEAYSPNKPPVAVANGPYTGTVGQAVQFSAQGTFDPEGAWNGTWTFGDGSSYTGTFGNFASQNPTHTYSAAGTYPVTFTVTDANGAAGTATTSATIQGSGANVRPRFRAKLCQRSR